MRTRTLGYYRKDSFLGMFIVFAIFGLSAAFVGNSMLQSSMGPTSSSASATGAIPGDLNADGVVDIKDMDLFAKELYKVKQNAYKVSYSSSDRSGITAKADLNGDGKIDKEDWKLFKEIYVSE